MAFRKFVQDHDPSDQEDYTFRFRLTPGETITGALVRVVSQTTGAPISSDLTIADLSFGVMPDPTLWGVTVWISGGTANATYYLNCQVTTNASPLPRIFNRTVILLCAEQ